MPDNSGYRGFRLEGVNNQPALWLGGCQLEIALPHAAVKSDPFLLETVLFPVCFAGKPLLSRNVQKHR